MLPAVASAPSRARSARSFSSTTPAHAPADRFALEALEQRRLLSAAAFAATPLLDVSFGAAGYAAPMPAGARGSTGAYDHLTPTPDGKFYAIGYGNPATFPSGYESFELMRLSADGSLDPTFANGGSVHVRYGDVVDFDIPWGGHAHFDGNSLNVGALIVQPDGKVLLAVQASPQFLPDPWLLMRLNPDGSPDASFGDNGSEVLPFQGLPNVYLRPDGKITLVQARAADNYDATFTVATLNPDGSPDTSVNPDGQLVDTVALEAPPGADPTSDTQWNGAQVLGGSALPDGGTVVYVEDDTNIDWQTRYTYVTQVRFDAAGNVVDTHTILRGDARPFYNDSTSLSLAVQPDGKALLLQAPSGQLTRFGLDGLPDRAFGQAGAVAAFPAGFDAAAGPITLDADGTLLVTLPDPTGHFGGLERLNPDGSVDSSFANGQPVFGFGDHQIIDNAAQLADGSIIASVRDSRFSPYYYYDPSYAPAGTQPPRLAKLLAPTGVPGTFDLQAAIDAAKPPPPPPPSDAGGDDNVDDTATDDNATDGSSDDNTDPSDPLR